MITWLGVNTAPPGKATFTISREREREREGGREKQTATKRQCKIKENPLSESDRCVHRTVEGKASETMYFTLKYNVLRYAVLLDNPFYHSSFCQLFY